MRRTLLLALAIIAALPAAAQAQQPVVYSSLPLSGPSARTSRDVVRGIRLALERAGSPVRYVSLNDATRRARTWMAERVSANARRAAQDDATVAYIGELNSGATAIALPILNAGEILQVSPSSTATGLTAGGPGTERGEPDKYYPTGDPTFGRVIPDDRVQAHAAGVMLRDAGVRRVLVVHDGFIYGRGMARLAAEAARARGIEVAGTRRLGRRGANAAAIARAARGADGVYFGGVGAGAAPRLFRALGRIKGLQLFGPDGIALPRFLRAIGGRTAGRTRMTVLPLAPEAYPPAGQEVLSTLGARTDPYALYGYEAMSVVLDALARGGGTRRGARDAFFATRDRESVLGRYSIDPFGDTSLTQYGVWRGSRSGSLVWDHAVDAAAP